MSEPTGARRYGVGGGDAYYDAVRYGGYEGTREQFGRDQAEFAQNAAAVAEAKETVERDTEEVRNTKNTFENTTVPEAIRALNQEGEDQILAITQKGEEVSQQVETVGTEQKDAIANEGRARVQAVEQAGTTQVQIVNDAGTAQVGNVNQAGEDQIDAVEQAGADQVQAVTDEGTTQVGAVNRAGSTQVQAVEDKGDEVLHSIPSDYTELVEDVDNLKESLKGFGSIDLGTFTDGYYINRNDGNTGTDSNSACSDFVSVQSGLALTINDIYTAGVRGVALYNSSKTYIGKSTQTGGDTSLTFIVPNDCAYIRVTCRKTKYATAFYDLSATITSFDQRKQNANIGSTYADDYLYIDSSGNIAHKPISKGAVGSANQIDANQIAETGWYRSTAASKQYLSNIPTDTTGAITLFTLCKTMSASYVAIQILIDQIGNTWFRLINTNTHASVTDWKQTIYANYPSARWTGKTIKCYGDSRTWYDGHEYGDRTKSEWRGNTCVGYQQTLASLTGATITSDGHSGATSTTICEYIRADNLSNVDAVFLAGGVNDYIVSNPPQAGQLEPIGSTFDTTTIYGALQSAVEYILTSYPNVKIFMAIPAIAWDENGVMPYTTAEIKGKVAELYNIPCIDLYKNGGINVVNRDYYYVDDVSLTNWRLHFNDYGNALIGAEIAGFINTH